MHLTTELIDVGFDTDNGDQFVQAQSQARKFDCDIVYFLEEACYCPQAQYSGTQENLDKLLEEIGYDEASMCMSGMKWVVVRDTSAIEASYRMVEIEVDPEDELEDL